MKTTKNLNIWLAMSMFLLLMVSTATAEIIFVDADASGANTGSSWAHAYYFLQDALAAASSGDQIWVAQGIYKPDHGGGNTPGSRTATFRLKNGVVLKGGYAGAGTPNPNARDIAAYETILSGDLYGNDGPDFANNSENSYHVVTGSGTDETAILDGFTITAGNANGSNPKDRGGGMYNYAGSPTVTNCTFSTNSARSRGGGMYNAFSNSTIVNCTFSENSAKGGGGIYNWHSIPTLTNCTSSGNSASAGGGMTNYWSSPTLTNCTIIANLASGPGGGMYNAIKSPTIVACMFSGNSSGGYGGGMCNATSSPILTNCAFTNNSAENGGGVYNGEDKGPAGFEPSDPTLTNCTFTGNTATSTGGGISNVRYSRPTVTNCILWDNTAASGPQIYDEETSLTIITYSNIKGGWPGEGNIDADPCFVEPGYWDANEVWVDGDYHLLPDSPCINAGDPNYVAEPNETDLDGKPRIIGGRVDMGAYEFYAPRNWYVDDDAPNDPGPGHPEISDPLEDGTQAHPFDAIQEAIDAAEYHDNVIILNGTYTGDGNRDIDFHGKAITVRSIDPNEPNIVEATVIDCEGRARGFNFHSGEDTNSVLAGLTITNGSADDGCGIYINSSSPLITRCAIIGNSSNRRKVDGGGICIRDGNPIISHCTVSENSIGNYSTYGGGIYCLNSNPVITHCTITNNYVRDRGGGIHCQSSSPLISHCIIKGNTASHRIGGGICSWGASPIITNCLITLNSSGDGGGGISLIGSNAAISQCTITGNSDRWFGGGIYFSLGSTIITNSILWGNTAPDGPEIAVNSWGGVMPHASEGMVRNSEPDYTSELTVSYSDVKGGQMGVYVFNDPRWFLLDWGDGNIDADPCFVEPGYWESPVPPPPPPPQQLTVVTSYTSGTQQYIWIEGDYHLLPYSVCIDAGDPNYVAEPNETDLDGKPRVMGGRIDMGAYETIPPIPAEVRITPRSINLASKGKWITCYIRLPDDYNVADIDSNSILLNCKIQAESVQVNEQQQITIARFYRSEVQSTLNIGEVELSIIGWLMDGTVFEGKDVIKVANKSSGKHDKYVQANDPNPTDGATSVSIYTDLSWTASPSATSHDVYFGTGSLPPFVCNQIATAFDPGTMGYGTTYYWRIDEVNKWGKTTGQLWSFTTIEGPVPPPPP